MEFKLLNVDRLTAKARGSLTLREVLMKRCCILRIVSRVIEQEMRGQGHNQMSCGFIRLML